MKKYILISLAAIILSFTSCVKPEEGGKDNPQPPTPAQEQITIPSTVDVKPVVSPEGGDTKISFTAASAWTASVISTKADSWVDVNPKSGDSGTAEITIATTPNDTYVERNATIQISCGGQTKEVVLTQKQVDNITVTTDKVELGVEGGTFTIELKSNIEFSYEINGDWIKYVSTKAYSDKTLTFSAEPNEGVQKREGSVTVKGGEFSETVKVYQSGEEPTLIITQNEYNLEAEGGSITVEVSSNVAVTMTIPESANWITENQTKSVSTSTFYLDVAVNETKEARSAEITFSNEESGLSEKVTVNQEGKIYVPVTDMVDLGLSVKWATCNIGASAPEEYGGYYQWAGIRDVTSADINLGFDNCPYHTPGSDYSTGWTKYVQSDKSAYWAGTGSPDNKTVLDPEDDIAYVTLGDNWRMPTDAEWTELRENCIWTWTDNYNGTGVAGRKVTSNITGYTDKSIFLPAAGYRDEVSLLSTGINGCYWSSSLESGRPYLAYWVLSYSSNVRRQNCYRFYGNSVRPVYVESEKVKVTGVSLEPKSINLNIEDTITLKATVTPSNATEKSVIWTSSDTGIATVDQGGKVTAVGAGDATITVRTTDGGHTATCSVTVKSSEPASDNIVFKDPVAKSACVAKYDANGDGEVSIAEAEAVTSFSGLFTKWKSVTSFDEISYFKNVHNIVGVFEGCDKLVSINLPENITDLAGAFKDCTSLIHVGLPSGITEIGNFAFWHCSKLASIDIPSKVTSIGSDAFNGCSSLVQVTIPDGVTSLSSYVFCGCSSLTSIYLPSGITSIGSHAFSGVKMWGLQLPSSVSSLESNCFGDDITCVLLPATSPVSIKAEESFGGVKGIFVPANMVEVYKVRPNWSKYWDRILPISSFKEKDAFVLATDGAADMGTSVKWAACNLGASKPEEYGGYYQWAGTQDVTSTSIYLDWRNCPYHTGYDLFSGWTKYVLSDDLSCWSGTGSPDNKIVLDSGDDAAHVARGGNWRMPTSEEFEELVNNCLLVWEGTTYHGVNGRMVYSLETGNKIFLPLGGDRAADNLYQVGSIGMYWSSSLDNEFYTGNIYTVFPFHFDLSLGGKGVDNITGRYVGLSVRPVYGGKISVTGVSVYPASINLNIEETYTLRATVTPSNSSEQDVRWTSSDTGVATVDHNGKVTGVKEGSVTITVTTTDGGYAATCSVTVKSSEPATPEMVDLGLSVKWATCNLGASRAEECGGYFQWAGTQDVTNIYLDSKNCPYHTGSSIDSGWTKYVTVSANGIVYGIVDDKRILESIDDVAHVWLGGKWRMPTIEEWDELRYNCNWTWTEINGISGYTVTSRKPGYTSNYIFLPAAGLRIGGDLHHLGSNGCYWSSSLHTMYPDSAEGFDFREMHKLSDDNYLRYYGLAVRPVSD